MKRVKWEEREDLEASGTLRGGEEPQSEDREMGLLVCNSVPVTEKERLVTR